MKKTGLALFIAAASLSAADAAAVETACCRNSDTPRWYVGISGSAVFMQDVDLKESFPVFGGQSESFDTGYGIGGEVGYRIYPNIRIELETVWRENDLSNVDGVKFSTGSSRTYSSERSLSIMGNLLYDYHNPTSIIPYIGVGAGLIDNRNPTILTLISPTFQIETEHFNSWVFGYQFMAGLSYELPVDVAPVAINLGYRYVGSEDGETSFSLIPGYKVKYGDTSQDIELGARVFF